MAQNNTDRIIPGERRTGNLLKEISAYRALNSPVVDELPAPHRGPSSAPDIQVRCAGGQ